MDNVVIRGGGDLATGIGHRLFRAGFKIIIMELEKPLSIRRKVSFCEAIYSGEIIVEGVKAVYCKDLDSSLKAIEEGNIPVMIDNLGINIHKIKPLAVVDCTLVKRNIGTNKDMAPITIAVGPGYIAGEDVNLVVESKRGHELGKVIYKGPAAINTGIPGEIMGYSDERIIRAIVSGPIKWNYQIGDLIDKYAVVGSISNKDIKAQISGVIRGLIKEGLYVDEGLKIGDIDPRGIQEYATTISDKARSIAGGVLEALMYLINVKKL